MKALAAQLPMGSGGGRPTASQARRGNQPLALCSVELGFWLEKAGPDLARMPERGLDGKDAQSPGESPGSPPALVAASAANPAGGRPGRVGHAADAKASPEHIPAAEARKPGDR